MLLATGLRGCLAGTLASELFEVGNCRFDLLGHEVVHVRPNRIALHPGQDEVSTKPVFDVFRVASASVVCIGALKAMGVYAVDTGDHHRLSALDGFQIVPKLRGVATGLCEAKSDRQWIL